MAEHELSVVRACAITRFSRAASYREPRAVLERDAEVIAALQAVVGKHQRRGFWKCFQRLRRKGHPWNRKRVHRVYCALRLNLPRRTKKRLPARVRQPLDAPATLNTVWALDFMSDALYGGRKFRTLNIIDDGDREGLMIDVAFSIPSTRVIRALDQLFSIYGGPEALRMDNGPELISEALMAWCGERDITMHHMQPGKPDQNAYIERFNRSYREEVLDAYLFGSIEEAQAISDEWLGDYNTERPHDRLGQVPFLPRKPIPGESSFELSH